MLLFSSIKRYFSTNANLIGSRYFDDNWFYSGIGERKTSHITDFIDSAIYLKQKGLAPKIGALGLGESGSVTALSSVFAEPLLFDAAAVYVIEKR